MSFPSTGPVLTGVKYFGTNGADTTTGTAGGDLIDGQLGNDLINGNGGADKLYGGAGNDRLSGGAGNDLLQGGKGVDALYGGAGNDTFAFSKADFDVSLGAKPQDFVWDFEGAGVAGGDFLRFSGFGADSTLTKVTTDSVVNALAKYNPGLDYYTLKDSNDGASYTIAIKTGGVVLSDSFDYHFYDTGALLA
ncbi:calcium-binding protein [Methylorubrum extorquens]